MGARRAAICLRATNNTQERRAAVEQGAGTHRCFPRAALRGLQAPRGHQQPRDERHAQQRLPARRERQAIAQRAALSRVQLSGAVAGQLLAPEHPQLQQGQLPAQHDLSASCK